MRTLVISVTSSMVTVLTRLPLIDARCCRIRMLFFQTSSAQLVMLSSVLQSNLAWEIVLGYLVCRRLSY